MNRQEAVMKVKYLKVKYGNDINIDQYPNFDKNGSITGMKKLYYGKDACLVQCGSYIYNVPYNIYKNIENGELINR